MPTYILAPAAIIALTLFAAFRIDRAEQFTDDFSDCDTRTASLADLINGGGDGASLKAGRGGGVEASSVGSLAQTHKQQTSPSSHSLDRRAL